MPDQSEPKRIQTPMPFDVGSMVKQFEDAMSKALAGAVDDIKASNAANLDATVMGMKGLRDRVGRLEERIDRLEARDGGVVSSPKPNVLRLRALLDELKLAIDAVDDPEDHASAEPDAG